MAKNHKVSGKQFISDVDLTDEEFDRLLPIVAEVADFVYAQEKVVYYYTYFNGVVRAATSPEFRIHSPSTTDHPL